MEPNSVSIALKKCREGQTKNSAVTIAEAVITMPYMAIEPIICAESMQCYCETEKYFPTYFSCKERVLIFL
jgi:hypothetical protein